MHPVELCGYLQRCSVFGLWHIEPDVQAAEEAGSQKHKEAKTFQVLLWNGEYFDSVPLLQVISQVTLLLEDTYH